MESGLTLGCIRGRRGAKIRIRISNSRQWLSMRTTAETKTPPTESLTSWASRGAFWALASNITVSAVSFVGTAILARMLDPQDFGLLGMAVLVTGIVQLFGNLGLGGALIQKKDVSQESLSTVFWVNVSIGTALTLICIAVSPLAALFFRQSAVQSILMLLSCTFLMSSLSSVHNTLVYKDLRMKPLAVIEISTRFLRVLVMLMAAYWGFRVWSIVIGIVVERFFKTAGLLLVFPWKPSFVFSKTKFNELFKFGRNLFGDVFLNYLNQNIDFIVTGRVLGVDLLGFYQMAYNLPFLVRGYISDSIGTVAFPVFCQLQDDNERLAKGYIRLVKFIAMATFPLLVGLAFCAEDFILVVYGSKWLTAVAPLKILCFSAALASIHAVVTPLLNAKGRPALSFKWNCLRLPLTISAILSGAKLYGILGVAWGMFIVETLSVVLIIIAFRLIRQSLGDYFRCFVPSVAACLLMLSVLVLVNQPFLLGGGLPVCRLLVNFVVGGSIYLSTVSLFFRNDWVEFKTFVRQVVKKNK